MLATLRTQEDLIAQILMDATGDTRRRFEPAIRRQQLRPGGGSWN
jgi:hypothetical protein